MWEFDYSHQFIINRMMVWTIAPDGAWVSLHKQPLGTLAAKILGEDETPLKCGFPGESWLQ